MDRSAPPAMTGSPEELNRLAVEKRRQGRWQESLEYYRRAIAANPNFAEAHYNLGLLCRDLGRTDEAIACFERTRALRPDVGQVHFGLANALAAARRWDEAIAAYGRALELAPSSQEIRFNLANTLFQAGKQDDAETCYRRLLELDPHDVKSLVNLGNVRAARGDVEDAHRCYDNALAFDPDCAAAMTNQGNLWRATGEFEKAAACYRRALQVSPDLPEAHTNLANVHAELGRFQESLEAYRRAAELRPHHAESHLHLANALANLRRDVEAVASYRRAIQLEPSSTDARLQLGRLFQRQGDVDSARRLYVEVHNAEPTNVLHALRTAAACPLVFASKAEMDRYREDLSRAAQLAAGQTLSVSLSHLVRVASECPYNLQFLDGNLRPLKQAFAQVYEDYFSKHHVSRPSDVRPRTQGNRPRIGFIVTAGHETAFVRLIGGVVLRLNSQQFDVVIICSRTGQSRLRQSFADRWPLVAYPERLDHAAETIRRIRCDLLYYWEVGTDPVSYFLPFCRLAPIQCTSWGIQVTSGISQVDYYLSSECVEPADAAEHYSERLVLGRTLLTYQEPNRREIDGDRSQFGFSSDQHLYACVQNLGKFHPEFDQLLAGILRNDPAGWLVIAQDARGYAAKILQQRFTRDIPDVASRIVFLPQLATDEYGKLIAACDVLLDPLHFGGVTTTYDALELEKPLVTLPSPFHRGRYTAGCYGKMKLLDCIAHNREDYVEIAVRLGTDAAWRAEVALRIRAAKHAVFEDSMAVAEHERIFQELLDGGR